MTKQQALPFIAAFVFTLVSVYSQVMAYLNENGKFPSIKDLLFLTGIRKERRAVIMLRLFCLGTFCIGLIQVYL